jgi:hypothetical protein
MFAFSELLMNHPLYRKARLSRMTEIQKEGEMVSQATIVQAVLRPPLMDLGNFPFEPSTADLNCTVSAHYSQNQSGAEQLQKATTATRLMTKSKTLQKAH